MSHPDVHGVVAEVDGRVAGSNFLWQREGVAGVGPISVDPELQNGAIGRRLMDAVLEQASRSGFASVRLVQAAYHSRSLSLYTKLGFVAREQLAAMQGPKIGSPIAGLRVRSADSADLDATTTLCRRVHGNERRFELRT